MARAGKPSPTRPPRAPGATRARAATSPATPGPPRTIFGRPTPVSQWRQRLSRAAASRRFTRIIALGSIVAFLAVVSGSTVAAYVAQRSEIAALRTQVAEQQRRVAELHGTMTRWEDPAYVEQQARQRLKFVRPGERSYTVVDAAPPEVVDDVPVDIATAGTSHAWYAAVSESITVADTPLPTVP